MDVKDKVCVVTGAASGIGEAVAAERFLILSHLSVHEYMQRKASGIDRWLAGMRRLRDRTYGVKRQG